MFFYNLYLKIIYALFKYSSIQIFKQWIVSNSTNSLNRTNNSNHHISFQFMVNGLSAQVEA